VLSEPLLYDAMFSNWLLGLLLDDPGMTRLWHGKIAHTPRQSRFGFSLLLKSYMNQGKPSHVHFEPLLYDAMFTNSRLLLDNPRHDPPIAR
jgi:hypothetical protein